MNRNKVYISLIVMIIIVKLSSISAQGMERVVLQLRWDHQFQFAGYYVALWEGYYEEEGLDVEIQSAFTDKEQVRQATDEVKEGRADFGVGAVDILIANDEEADLSVLASIFQRSATEFYMKEDTPFSTISDLVDLNVARRKGDLMDIELQAMLMAEGIDPEHVKLYKRQGNFTINDLTQERFDVIPIYLRNILSDTDNKGIKLKSIKPVDYGIDFYGDSLFTRNDLVKKDPEMVDAFKRASLKGWEYALKNPDKTIEKMISKFSIAEDEESKFRKFNQFQAKEVLDLTLYPVVEIGNINPHRWEKTQEVLKELDLISSNNIDKEDFIFDYDAILQQRSQDKKKDLEIFALISSIILCVLLIIYLTAKETIKRLEKMFQSEWQENKRKEGIIIYQARLSAMGEMVANIAHQWRQPLNNLGLILTNIEDAYRYDELTKEKLKKDIERSQNLIDKMSETIDDFRNFTNPNIKKSYFTVYESITLVLDLMDERLKLHNIKLCFRNITLEKAYGYNNQFSQAIFNILNNSIDALIQNRKNNRRIWVNMEAEDDEIIVEIEDNGGGISEAIGNQIFQLHFTTKEEGKGTGIGLYTTKVIIEKNLDGRIQWQNTDKGTKMQVIIPTSERKSH